MAPPGHSGTRVSEAPSEVPNHPTTELLPRMGAAGAQGANSTLLTARPTPGTDTHPVWARAHVPSISKPTLSPVPRAHHGARAAVPACRACAPGSCVGARSDLGQIALEFITVSQGGSSSPLHGSPGGPRHFPLAWGRQLPAATRCASHHVPSLRASGTLGFPEHGRAPEPDKPLSSQLAVIKPLQLIVFNALPRGARRAASERGCPTPRSGCAEWLLRGRRGGLG